MWKVLFFSFITNFFFMKPILIGYISHHGFFFMKPILIEYISHHGFFFMIPILIGYIRITDFFMKPILIGYISHSDFSHFFTCRASWGWCVMFYCFVCRNYVQRPG